MRIIKQVIGYTTGVFDLFHIGHLNILRNAKSMCDFLIVGVSTDELVMSYKNKKPVIPFTERIEIVRNLKFVDLAIPQYDMNKLEVCKQLKADRVFVGDGWYGTEKWDKIETELKQNGVDVFYFPYTNNISSTMINNILDEKRQNISEQEIERLKTGKDLYKGSFNENF